MDKQLTRKLGGYSFLLGIIIAVLAGVAVWANIGVPSDAVYALLLVFGFIVGGLNIQTKETTGFLVAVIALATLSNLVGIVGLSSFLTQTGVNVGGFFVAILNNIVVFAVPAGVIVAFKAFYNYASVPIA